MIEPLRECPEAGRWTLVLGLHPQAPLLGTLKFGGLPNGVIPLSGDITDIVEFHDCQRFIVQPDSTQPMRYSSLFAIFARLHLERRYQPLRKLDSAFNPETMGTPMATILALEESYDNLGIKRGFNCLYFFATSNGKNAYEARVVPVDTLPKACLVPLARNDLRGTPLTVSVMTRAKDGIDLPPPVARWDWDTVNRRQYIGIRCGQAWCEVNPKMQPGQTFRTSQPLPVLKKQAKGWYDEQLLAVAHDLSGRPDEVSAITGTIAPYEEHDPEFGPPEASNFAFKWRPSAKVAIRGNPGGYVSKLNLFDSGNSLTVNIVSMCYIPERKRNTCVPAGALMPGCTATSGWFAKVWHATGSGQNVTKYFCVTRTAHDGSTMDPPPPVPNAPRWRWAIDDETMWIACMSGCCEVKAR